MYTNLRKEVLKAFQISVCWWQLWQKYKILILRMLPVNIFHFFWQVLFMYCFGFRVTAGSECLWGSLFLWVVHCIVASTLMLCALIYIFLHVFLELTVCSWSVEFLKIFQRRRDFKRILWLQNTSSPLSWCFILLLDFSCTELRNYLFGFIAKYVNM